MKGHLQRCRGPVTGGAGEPDEPGGHEAAARHPALWYRVLRGTDS